MWDVMAAGRAGVPGIGLLCGGIGEAELREAGAVEVYADPAALLGKLAASVIGQLTAGAGAAPASWKRCPSGRPPQSQYGGVAARLGAGGPASGAAASQRRRDRTGRDAAGSQPRVVPGAPAQKPSPPAQYWPRCTARTREPTGTRARRRIRGQNRIVLPPLDGRAAAHAA